MASLVRFRRSPYRGGRWRRAHMERREAEAGAYSKRRKIVRVGFEH